MFGFSPDMVDKIVQAAQEQRLLKNLEQLISICSIEIRSSNQGTFEKFVKILKVNLTWKGEEFDQTQPKVEKAKNILKLEKNAYMIKAMNAEHMWKDGKKVPFELTEFEDCN